MCARGTRPARGHGETRARTELEAPDRKTPVAANRPRRERLPGNTAHDRPREGALSGPRGPLPTRVQDLSPLPGAYHAALDAGLAGLGLVLDPAARDAIDAHARFLLAWTDAINLTAIRDPEAVARLHVLDSLAAVPVLARRGLTRPLDLGSGGGYPGIPLAAALGADRALLVDSVGKKVRFLRTVVDATGLGRRIAAEQARAEVLARDPRDREAWPVVTARAVTSLAELVEIGLPLVAPDGVLVAWKRGPVDDELAAADRALHALRAGPVEVIPVTVPGLEAHRLVVVPRGGRIDARFPRDPAERRHRPL
jgi:16S rRNA (guanine527-N7)-methyltransferase